MSNPPLFVLSSQIQSKNNLIIRHIGSRKNREWRLKRCQRSVAIGFLSTVSRQLND